MADGLALAYGFLLNKLSGDATLATLGTPALGAGTAMRAWRKRAPEGGALPYVRYDLLSWMDMNGLGPQRCSARGVFIVSAINEGRALADVRAIISRVDTLLQGIHAESYQGLTWSSELTEQFDALPVVNGKEYLELGWRGLLWASGF